MVSMADIAKVANVSRTTVSLVLNDRHIAGVGISEATRRRVKAAARRLGYRPNQLAQSVATGRSHLIGCAGLDVVNNSALSVPSLIAGAVHYAERRDCAIKMLPAGAGVDELVDRCVSYRMCGVLMRTRDRAFMEAFVAALAPHGIPVVLIDSPFDNPPAPSVVADDRDGMRQVVEYLISLGHRRLVYVAYEAFQVFTRRRLLGFEGAVAKAGGRVEGVFRHTDEGSPREALRRIGAEGDGVRGVFCNTDDGRPLPVYERAELILRDLLQGGDVPDAFVCNCDEIALNTLCAVWRAGLRVPEDVSVTGFGNLPVGELATPPLTSLTVPCARIAEMAIDLVLAGPGEPRELVLPVSIQIRQSTRPKRASGPGASGMSERRRAAAVPALSAVGREK